MVTLVSRVAERVRAMPKMRRFAVFLAITAIIAAVASAIAWATVFREERGEPVVVAVVAPLSGPAARQGAAIVAGAEQWLARQPTVRRRPLALRLVDSHGQADALAAIAAQPDVAAVLALGGSPTDEGVAAQHGLPRIMLAGQPARAEAWSFPLSAHPVLEARFLANYVRNVVGERLVSVLRPNTAQDEEVAAAFDETLRRFGTRVVYNWPIATAPEERGAALRAVARDIAERQVAGAILVLGEPDFAAEAIAELGAAEVSNRVVGLRSLASQDFMAKAQAAWRGPGSLASALNGTLVATPLLFDTAGVEAQAFQATFRATTRMAPDWLAVLAHDGLRTIAQALARIEAPASADGSALRRPLRDALQRHDSAASALPGLGGPIFFDERGSGALPVMVGAFDGETLVAAPTQLTPIHEEGVTNYIEQLQAGRILYVNDRFMYRTNVVSTGIEINKVSGLSVEANTVELEFMLWFRWRGALAAQDVVFENAVGPISLGEPERTIDEGEHHYRAWRVRGRFFLNSSTAPRPFGKQLVSVAFRHRTLARNNLMYVADVVGMDLAGPYAAAEAGDGWLVRMLGAPAGSGSVLARRLAEAGVLAGVPGSVVDQAFLSQELVRSGTTGDPAYVGYGKPAPIFSRIAMDVLVKPDRIDLRALLPQQALVYLAIFALAGAVLARLLDRRDRGQFWRMQTLVLRLITWPTLLATLGVLGLDYAAARSSLWVVETIDFAVGAAWWLILARLLSLAIDRFIWAPLEARTERRVPTVFRIVVAALIYAGAMLGIIAVVLGKTIGSLLATSGLLTLIIGLAVQSNLKDIFSGVVLNLERPFVLGDWVRINSTYGQVHDISWRTTRLRTPDGQIISFANGRVVDAEIENLTRAGFYDASIQIYLDPRCPPAQAIAALQRAVESVTDVPFKPCGVALTRVEAVQGSFAARYNVELQVELWRYRVRLRNTLWPAIWLAMEQAGLVWAMLPQKLETKT
jgi:branched-chain amino acid transport system substrate-binding protein